MLGAQALRSKNKAARKEKEKRAKQKQAERERQLKAEEVNQRVQQLDSIHRRSSSVKDGGHRLSPPPNDKRRSSVEGRKGSQKMASSNGQTPTAEASEKSSKRSFTFC